MLTLKTVIGFVKCANWVVKCVNNSKHAVVFSDGESVIQHENLYFDNVVTFDWLVTPMHDFREALNPASLTYTFVQQHVFSCVLNESLKYEKIILLKPKVNFE